MLSPTTRHGRQREHEYPSVFPSARPALPPPEYPHFTSPSLRFPLSDTEPSVPPSAPPLSYRSSWLCPPFPVPRGRSPCSTSTTCGPAQSRGLPIGHVIHPADHLHHPPPPPLTLAPPTPLGFRIVPLLRLAPQTYPPTMIEMGASQASCPDTDPPQHINDALLQAHEEPGLTRRRNLLPPVHHHTPPPSDTTYRTHRSRGARHGRSTLSRHGTAHIRATPFSTTVARTETPLEHDHTAGPALAPETSAALSRLRRDPRSVYHRSCPAAILAAARGLAEADFRCLRPVSTLPHPDASPTYRGPHLLGRPRPRPLSPLLPLPAPSTESFCCRRYTNPVLLRSVQDTISEHPAHVLSALRPSPSPSPTSDNNPTLESAVTAAQVSSGSALRDATTRLLHSIHDFFESGAPRLLSA